MKTKSFLGRLALPSILTCTMLLLAGLCLPTPAQVVFYTWTNTANGASGYWTNTANWSPSSGYPGSAATGDNANINTDTANTYNTILDAAIPNQIGGLALDNNGAGEMWLLIRNGGSLSVQSGSSMAGGANLVVSGSGHFDSGYYPLSITGNGNSVLVTNGGNITTSSGVGSSIFLGSNQYGTGTGSGNSLTITGSESSLTNGAGLRLGNGSASVSNTMSVLNGGKVVTGVSTIGGGSSGCASNELVISGPGSSLAVTYNSSMYIGTAGAGNEFNSLTVSNGGALVFNGGVNYFYVGQGVGANNNALNVGGLGASSTVTHGYYLQIGKDGGEFNTMIVTNAAMTTGYFTVGANATNNTATITTGGRVLASSVAAGSGTATGNVLRILAGGLLEANSLATGAGAGNLITNGGGIYQFTKSFNDGTWPANVITNGAGPGSIVLDNGIISFRNVSHSQFNIRENWNTVLTNITFIGNNALRLDNSSVKQPTTGSYTFDTGLGSTNYYRLEMINGTTALPSGLGITIGSGGSLLVSNTIATISGGFTNAGSVLVTGNGKLTLGSTLAQTAGTLRVDGTLSASTAPVLLGGLVMGTGSIYTPGWTLTNGVVLSPGASPGTLTFSNLTLQSTAVYAYEGGDLTAVLDTLVLENDWVLNLGGRFVPGTNTYTLFTYGTLGGGADLTPVLAGAWTDSLTLTDLGGSLVLANAQFVPEPSLLLLLVCGGWLLARWRRRR